MEDLDETWPARTSLVPQIAAEVVAPPRSSAMCQLLTHAAQHRGLSDGYSGSAIGRRIGDLESSPSGPVGIAYSIFSAITVNTIVLPAILLMTGIDFRVIIFPLTSISRSSVVSGRPSFVDLS
jgi:hypothetical protein